MFNCRFKDHFYDLTEGNPKGVVVHLKSSRFRLAQGAQAH